MKKITAIFLALAVLVLFASCDNNDNPTTTQGPIATGYVPSQSSTVPSTPGNCLIGTCGKNISQTNSRS